MFKFCWHCWHHIDNTRRKIKNPFRNCKESDPYVSEDHIKYIMQKRCCKCGKIKETDIYRDYQINRGLEYPPYEINE